MRNPLRFILQHGLAFKTSLCNLMMSPLATLTTILAMGVSLSLPISLYIFTNHLQEVSQGWNQGTSITLYIDAKIQDAKLNTILTQAKNYPSAIKTHYLTADEALQEFERHTSLGDTLALLPENPLPGVITIHFNPKLETTQSLLSIKDHFAKMPGVQIASLDDEWTEKLKTLITFGKTLSQFLYFIIGLSVVLMVANTLRLALENHREEIEVLNLIGATQRFIRRPFLYRGMVYGLLGGLIALGILWGEIHFFQAPVQDLSSLFEHFFTLQHLQSDHALLFLIFTLMLGWMGAFWAFHQQKRAILK